MLLQTTPKRRRLRRESNAIVNGLEVQLVLMLARNMLIVKLQELRDVGEGDRGTAGAELSGSWSSLLEAFF